MPKHAILKKGLVAFFCSFFLILLDQLTKYAAVTGLKGQNPLVIWNGVFELRYLENRGAAFGLMQGQRMIFIPCTIVILIVIVYFFLRKIPNERRFIWLDIIAVLFFSGAIGNFIDRITQNYVVDFFYFVLIDFPIFNVADIYVTVAAFLLILLGFFYYKEEDFERILPSKKKEIS